MFICSIMKLSILFKLFSIMIFNQFISSIKDAMQMRNSSCKLLLVSFLIVQSLYLLSLQYVTLSQQTSYQVIMVDRLVVLHPLVHVIVFLGSMTFFELSLTLLSTKLNANLENLIVVPSCKPKIGCSKISQLSIKTTTQSKWMYQSNIWVSKSNLMLNTISLVLFEEPITISKYYNSS